MSETPVSGNDPTERLNDALIALTGCVGEALDDICSYSLTIGETYVPFDPDEDDECEDDEAVCSQAWVRVMTVAPVNKAESFEIGDGCYVTLGMTLEIGVYRCLDIPEGGEAPTASDVLVAAMQSMTDMRAIYCAVMSCGGEEGPGFDSIESGTWTPSGPLGGQYGGIWTFDVEI